MSELQPRRIRVDWEELEDAFVDPSSEHRYYLDRDTGAVHFFSAYLDNDEEAEDERGLTDEGRFVLIPYDRRAISSEELREFVASLEPAPDRKVLESTLSAPEGTKRFHETVSSLPVARRHWKKFMEARLEVRIKEWLDEVAVEPL